MEYRGTLHIIRHGNSCYNTTFKRYSGRDARRPRRFEGIDPVTRFLEYDMRVKRDVIDEMILRLHIEGHASIQDVGASESDLQRLGFLD